MQDKLNLIGQHQLGSWAAFMDTGNECATTLNTVIQDYLHDKLTTDIKVNTDCNSYGLGWNEGFWRPYEQANAELGISLDEDRIRRIVREELNKHKERVAPLNFGIIGKYRIKHR